MSWNSPADLNKMPDFEIAMAISLLFFILLQASGTTYWIELTPTDIVIKDRPIHSSNSTVIVPYIEIDTMTIKKPGILGLCPVVINTKNPLACNKLMVIKTAIILGLTNPEAIRFKEDMLSRRDKILSA